MHDAPTSLHVTALDRMGGRYSLVSCAAVFSAPLPGCLSALHSATTATTSIPLLPPPPPVRFSDAQDTELTGCDGAALLRRDLWRRRRERVQLAPRSHPIARGARRAGAVGAGEVVPERRGEGRLRQCEARVAGGRDLFQDQRELRGSAGAHRTAHRHREREPGDGGAPAGARGACGGLAAPRHPQGGGRSCGAAAQPQETQRRETGQELNFI